MIARTLSIAAAAACLAAALAPAAANAAKPDTGGALVCNEAENSWQGGYEVTGGPVDPNPPAFLRGSQKLVGNGHGVGLENAAEHSPALRLCGPRAATTAAAARPAESDALRTAPAGAVRHSIQPQARAGIDRVAAPGWCEGRSRPRRQPASVSLRLRARRGPLADPARRLDARAELPHVDAQPQPGPCEHPTPPP